MLTGVALDGLLKRLRYVIALQVVSFTLCGAAAQGASSPENTSLSMLQKEFVGLYLRAEKGDADAQYAVGMMYYSGRQVSQDKALAAVWFEKAAKQGHRDAQYFLSLIYGLGDGVARNTPAAVRWCCAAAGWGHPDAQYSFGRMYATGQGVPRDDVQAVQWLTKAAQQGHADAQCDLGMMYKSGRGVERDMNQAIQWWTAASEQGHPWSTLLLQEAMQLSGVKSTAIPNTLKNNESDDLLGVLGNDLGLSESPGNSPSELSEESPAPTVEVVSKTVDSDKDNAVQQQTAIIPPVSEAKTAEEISVESSPVPAVKLPAPQKEPPLITKDSSACYDLAVQYYEGRGVEQDYTQAAEWFQKAAEQGNSQAQYKLGVMYSFGQGVAQDSVEAVQWFRKAAEQELPEAQYCLGVMYATGQGVGRDYAAAAQWYTRAANGGSAAAQYMLGVIYSKGQGVTRDSETSLQWYIKAAEQGVPTAQYLLAVLYEKGQGVVIPNEAESLKWYTMAAEHGHADAQYELAMKYMVGQGAEQDFVKAYTWCLVAALNNKDVAAQEQWLEQKMTKEQLEQSRLLAREILKNAAKQKKTTSVLS